jgi:hypothetical protein
VVGGRQGVGEAGAHHVDVHGGGPGNTEPGGDPGGHVRGAVDGRRGGDEHQVDVGGGEAGRRERLGGGVRGQFVHGLVGSGDVPRPDADPAADPLVAGVDQARQVLVGEDPGGLVVADGGDARAVHGVPPRAR